VADDPLVANEDDLADLLAERRMLIVLDNCEHVVQAAARVAEAILSAAPGVHLLATSREPVRAAGECVLRLAPLALPPASATLSAPQALGFSAIQLFTQRTAAIDTGFVLTDADVPVVVEICRQLDGIPLALELAAGRVAQLGLCGLATRLTDRLSALGKGRRTAVPRQQTLRATLDWSYELLSDEEQAVLRRLSVFAGAFTFDSAVAVCEDDRPGDPYEAIDDLVLKSLISVDTGASVAHYRLLEMTRAYAFEKLKAAGELEAASRAHAQHVCSVFEGLDAASSLDDAAGDAAHVRWIDDIQLAVQASFGTLRDPGLGMRLLAATAPVWYARSLIDEYRQKAEMALQEARGLAEQPEATLMRLWYSLGHCYFYTKGADPDVALAFGRTYELARRLRNVKFERMALWGLWAERVGYSDYAASLALARQDAALIPFSTEPEVEVRSRRMLQWSLHLMGEQAASQQEAMAALSIIGRTDDRRRALGRVQIEPRAGTNAVLARVLWIQGLPDQALAVAAEGVQSARTAQHVLTLCYAMFGQCAVLLWCGSWADLGRQADALMDIATDRRMTFWKAWAQGFKDAHAYGAHGLVVPQPSDLVISAHQLEMMATVSDELLHDDVLLRAEAGQCPWVAPEVLRAQGERLLRQGAPPQEGEAWFARALALARKSQALSWELRAATSLARCWSSQGRHAEGTALLGDVLARCKEGFDTLDLQRARKFMDRNEARSEAPAGRGPQ
jgi:predicted ATPase